LKLNILLIVIFEYDCNKKVTIIKTKT